MKTYGVRFHNIYGPPCVYDGGKEKSPATICRKIALAKKADKIEVWRDGKQTRSYCYIDNCLEGIYRVMQSKYHDPLNIGPGGLVNVDELVDIVSDIAGEKDKKAL